MSTNRGMSKIRIARLALALALLAGEVLAASSAQPGGEQNPATRVQAVLNEETYPWYDRDRDDVRPMLPDPSSWTAWLGKQVDAVLEWIDRQFRSKPAPEPEQGRTGGSILPMLLFLTSGGIFLLVLWRLWRFHEPRAEPTGKSASSVGEVARMAGLQAGSSLDGIDPWAEAARRRAAGDLAGAVIWLFLDQLLSLDRLGMIHLTPGKTARQYVYALDDRRLREELIASLAAFEAVYYGHRLPDPASLNQLWLRAEAFRARVKALGRTT